MLSQSPLIWNSSAATRVRNGWSAQTASPSSEAVDGYTAIGQAGVLPENDTFELLGLDAGPSPGMMFARKESRAGDSVIGAETSRATHWWSRSVVPAQSRDAWSMRTVAFAGVG